jgi:hypothetical protein
MRQTRKMQSESKPVETLNRAVARPEFSGSNGLIFVTLKRGRSRGGACGRGAHRQF